MAWTENPRRALRLQTDPDCFVNLWNEDSASALKTEALDTLLNLMVGNIDPRHEQVGLC